MPYLLDTDVISATLRPRPNLDVVRRLATLGPGDVFTSAITLGELVFGASRVGRDDLTERVLRLPPVLPALPFDEAAAIRFGHLKAELERSGMPLPEPDLRIAAIALSAGLTLVTGNERHFVRVPGLSLENWLA
jgi:tRNA(fMet)-specific endonuclease VapC